MKEMSDGEIYAKVSEMLDNKRTRNEAVDAALKEVATTRYYEGDGHLDAGYMLALAFKNIEALRR